jgi:5'-phosphate synthase pdxT subunit
MGLIGTATKQNQQNMWDCLQDFSNRKPVWGTCAGMILLADRCIGTSAVIQDGQALIGGVNITVCRNFFGSQVSSFEMATTPPPNSEDCATPYPGVFIRAPAILSAGPDVQVLGRVVATPCRQAAVTLHELEKKIAAGENVVKFGVVDSLDRNDGLHYKVVMQSANEVEEEKKSSVGDDSRVIVLPGAADGTNAREVISAVQKGTILCTAFHPELTEDYRWHKYFLDIVENSSLMN